MEQDEQASSSGLEISLSPPIRSVQLALPSSVDKFKNLLKNRSLVELEKKINDAVEQEVVTGRDLDKTIELANLNVKRQRVMFQNERKAKTAMFSVSHTNAVDAFRIPGTRQFSFYLRTNSDEYDRVVALIKSMRAEIGIEI